MFYNRLFLLSFTCIALFFCIHQTANAQGNIVKWEVEKNSTLEVNGKSNVNSFTCNVNGYTKKDTIVCSDKHSKPIALSGEVQMDVVSFNCHSGLITKNLRKTLKADEYPQMSIRFLSLDNMPGLQRTSQRIKGWVEVELAGVVKRIELTYSFLNTDPLNMQLNGAQSFRFSDFKLSPPRKLGGLIKIKDDFDVHFQLILKNV